VTTVLEEHGTRVAYASGCHCDPCRKANAAYVAERRRSPKGHVALGQVRSHVKELRAAGMSWREIGRLSGVHEATVRRIVSGAVAGCSPSTRSRLLAVMPRCVANHISVVRDDAPEVEGDSEPTFDDPLAALRLLLASPEELDWKAEGECGRLSIPIERRHLWFFPARGESTGPALSICALCPVWQPCLTFALQTGAEGVWGRTAGAHRRKIIHHGITVEELAAAGMDDGLAVAEAIERVVASR
jgi:hypothetical protein